jgi:reactive intermediate/imine deaminase
MYKKFIEGSNLMSRVIIRTEAAPAAIGTYSQAVKIGTTVYLSGQIPLVPASMQMVSEVFSEQTHQVFKNLAAVCEAAGGTLNNMVKVNIFLIDLSQFATVNQIMSEYFAEPYPARAAVQVSALPRAAQIEIDGVMEVPSTQ